MALWVFSVGRLYTESSSLVNCARAIPALCLWDGMCDGRAHNQRAPYGPHAWGLTASLSGRWLTTSLARARSQLWGSARAQMRATTRRKEGCGEYTDRSVVGQALRGAFSSAASSAQCIFSIFSAYSQQSPRGDYGTDSGRSPQTVAPPSRLSPPSRSPELGWQVAMRHPQASAGMRHDQPSQRFPRRSACRARAWLPQAYCLQRPLSPRRRPPAYAACPLGPRGHPPAR